VPKDTHPTTTSDRAEFELPEQVTVAVAELASAAREGLLALAVGTGLQVLQAMLAEDVARLVGPKGRHNPARAAVRHGSEPGQVTLGGRRVRIRRPRVRSADGARELPVPTYQAFAPTELLDQLAFAPEGRSFEPGLTLEAHPVEVGLALEGRAIEPRGRESGATIYLRRSRQEALQQIGADEHPGVHQPYPQCRCE
jgi:hypothetical protein